MSKLEDSLESLFHPTPIDDETAQRFLDILLRNYETAESRMYKRFVAITLLWLVGFGVSLGVLSEASIFGIKVRDLGQLLIGFPLLISLAYLGMLASFCALANSWFSIRRVLKHHLPRLYEADLEHLILPPTALTSEMISFFHETGFKSKLHIAWLVAVCSALLLTPLALGTHLAMTALSHSSMPFATNLALILAALLVAIRALTLFAQLSNWQMEGRQTG